ncbi:MAG: hypothetical protein HYV39_01950 [Candidatus Levybacteria bacterium]|nr:hypothetical protein [Candidatus Levybacteria bacterium]
MPDIFTEKTETITPPISKPTHTHHLASFCDHPEGITFENQEPDEEILLFLRRHFITNIPWIFLALILALLPPLLSLIAPTIPTFLFTSLPTTFLHIFLIFYYLVIFTFVLVEFITWYFNISIITQKRIIDIDFSDLIYHDVAVTKLNLVEDTNYTQTGFIRSLFNYGDVFVQTAGEKLHFDFLAVPRPTTVVNIIQNLIGKNHA